MIVAPSEMSFIAGKIIEGQGKCFVHAQHSVFVYIIGVCLSMEALEALEALSWNNERKRSTLHVLMHPLQLKGY